MVGNTGPEIEELKYAAYIHLQDMSHDSLQHMFQSWVELCNKWDVTLKRCSGHRYVRIVCS